MSQIAECEGIAAELLDRGGFDGSPDPWEIAASLRIGVRFGQPGVRPHPEPHRGRWRIVLNPAERREAQGMTLLHEIAHLLNRAAGIRDTEQHAWWTALALMFPRVDFLARRRRHGWAIDEIRVHYPCASHEATARRLLMMESAAILWVWDAIGPRRRRYPVLSPGWRWPRREPTPLEREAMQAALDERTAVEPIGGVRAWCVEDPPWVRILCLSDGEVLLAQDGIRECAHKIAHSTVLVLDYA